MNVLFVPADLGGCGYYRCMVPAMAGGWKWSGFGRGNLDQNLNAIEHFDVIVFERLLNKAGFDQIKQAQALGKKVVYEIDDYMKGIGNLDYHHSKKPYSNKKTEQMYELCMKTADAMIVSTVELEKRYRKFNKNIHVVENCLDMPRWQYDIPQRDTVNIGWAGGSDHGKDLLLLSGVLEELSEKYGDKIKMVFIGGPGVDFFKGVKIETLPWSTIENYPSVLTNFDIGLAPIVDNAFNQCKSDLKLLEYGALKIPTIASPIKPYKQAKEKGFPVVLAQTKKEWVDAVSLYIEDEDERRDAGWKSFDYVLQNRTTDNMVKRYNEVLERVISDN